MPQNFAYLPRIVDGVLDQLLDGAPAIALRGARGVGKTATASRRAATTYNLDDEQTRAVVAADPRRLLSGPKPILIDEWQLMPQSWDLVRRAVDRDRTAAQFLLTGSASPTTPPAHSGAGRIVSVVMRPMALAERGLTDPTVSLAELLTGRRGSIEGATHLSAEIYAHEILASGFPGLRGLPVPIVRAQLESYIEHAIDRDFTDQGRPIRNRASLMRWLRAYSGAVSSTASYEKIRDAASGGTSEKPAKTTVLNYIDVLESIWLIDPVPAWKPELNELRRLALSPKHQLVDPALAARLRRVSVATLLDGQAPGALNQRYSTLFGALFEAQVTHDVRVYSQPADASAFHFRDRDGGHEIDLIVEGPDQGVVAIETKLAATVNDGDVRHLVWLRDRIGDQLRDAVVVTTGREAYRRRDGVAVVPAALLGP
ncbi:MAG: DUF4143 domain-containing protein [Chloroflexota bacterium]